MNNTNFNVEFQVIPESLEKPFQDLFPSYPNGLVRGEPGGYIMPATFTTEAAKEIWEMRARKDDVWIVTFPKSGTTWMSELVWLLKNNLEYEKAGKTLIMERTFYPEMKYYVGRDVMEKLTASFGRPPFKSAKEIDELPSPRVIRPHLSLDLLNPDLLNSTKVIYVARNPKDVIVSYFYHQKMVKAHSYKGDFAQFVEFFMKTRLMCTPYFHHVLTAWQMRDHPNMCFVFYEDMKKDLTREIKRIARFLEVEITDEELHKLANHLDFVSFEENESVNQNAGVKFGFSNGDVKFMRKGVIGDWKNHFSPELNERVDEWIADNLAGTDLKFIFE